MDQVGGSSRRCGPCPPDRLAADGGPTPEAVVRAAAEAADAVVFDRYRKSEVDDLDVTVQFENDILEVDVYLDAPGDAALVADEAARAARAAADQLLE